MRREQATPALTSSSVRPRGRRLGPALIGLILGVLGSILLGVVLMGPLVVAKRNDLLLERAYGNFAVSVAARFAAGNLQNPVAQNPRAVAAGRDAYTGSCSVCHGGSGDGRGVFGTSSYPNASDLTSHDAAEKSDGEMFWIIKNGLSFTGMPGFAEQYADQEIWSMVTYVRVLQDPRSGPGAGTQGGPPAGQAPANPTPNSQVAQPPGAGGSGRQFQFGPIDVAKPTAEQLDRADPTSSDPAARGAAIFFAQGCHMCHGAVGDAPANLGLSRVSGDDAVRAIRGGRPGMPTYNQAMLSDAELSNLEAYLATFGPTRPRGGGG
ncbi:MAG: c-type cytochrome [Chloroflexota bacterium]|nr:c-type cytochrome [Chloroflexota bacterium]